MRPMRCDKRPRVEAIEEVNDPPKFMITDRTPPLLLAWWNDMQQFKRTEIFKHLGFLTDIMAFISDRDLIEALIPFWDSANNVFHFSDFELTPTLEELGGFTELGRNLRSKTLIGPRNVSKNKFLEQMHIIHPHLGCMDNGWVSLEFLYSRYGRKEGFKEYGKQLKNGQHFHTWEKHRQEAFMVAFLGTVVFPRRDKKISIRLSGIVTVMMKKNNFTILPMILADIYRALAKCGEGEDYFEGCSILLQMWFLEHLYRHRYAVDFKSDWSRYILSHPDRMEELKDKFPKGVKAWTQYLLKLTASEITWNYHWFPSSEVVVMSSYRPFFVMTGFRGFQPYTLLRVLRQLGQKQILLAAEDTRDIVWEVTFEDLHRESEAQKIWSGNRTLSSKSMVEDRVQGEVDPLYLHWFFDQAPVKVRPEGSVRETIDREVEIEMRIKQARLDVEENYQSTLHVLNKDLKIAQENLAQAEARSKAQVMVAQKRVEREQHLTIRKLHEDLYIMMGAMEQQKNASEEEKALLIHANAKLQMQLNASMEREREIAKRFSAHQAEVEVKENQWMIERDGLHTQVEELQKQEDHLNHEVYTTRQWVRNCHENIEEAKGRVLQLAESLIDVYDGCLHKNDESLGRQARALAPHLPKALFDIYSNLGGN